jgi:hypothetical protein
MDEREIVNAWHKIFRGGQLTPEILASAEQLLNHISGESPIRFRLERELEELKSGPPKAKMKRTLRSNTGV